MRSAHHKRTKKKLTIVSPEIQNRFFVRKDALFLLIIVAISLFLNLLGFGWGMDGQVPWTADGIEGITTVREMPKLFGKWTYKYPRLQFLIDGLCYKPWIKHWEKNPVYSQHSGQRKGQTLTLERLNTLAIISRINILMMSVLIIIFIYLIAKFYYADSIAAFFASFSLAVCYIFVYYSHTSCVDIPSTLWITIGVYFLIRSIRLNKMSCHIFMGLFFALACCTKDAMLFYAFAFAIVYLTMRIHLLHTEGIPLRKCFLALFNRNTLLAVIVFLFIFALLQNIFVSPKAYWDRMGVWVGGRGVKDFNQSFKGQWDLLWKTLKMFYWSIGWPLLALVLISLVFTTPKHRLFNLLIAVFPLVFFYVFISMRVKMTFIRYYLPVIGFLFLPVGASISQLFSLKKKNLFRISVSLISGIYILSLSYCVALNIALINDSRNQTAKWFQNNVNKNTPVLSLINRPYGPKLSKHGYPVIENWNVPPLESLLKNKNRLPDYLVLSTYWHTIKTTEARAFRKALLEGQGGYSKIIQFKQKKAIGPRNPLSVACWPLRPNRGVSPMVIVMKKKASD